MELVPERFIPKNISKIMELNLKKVPETPGVYKFFNNSEIIYIGKAKNLKKKSIKLFWQCSKRQKNFPNKKINRSN